MLYFIHNPTNNVVIRTNNPLIVQQHQSRGWLTATSFDGLLLEHPEWRPRPDRWSARCTKATNFVLRVCSSVLTKLTPALSFAPLYTPSGTAAVVSLLAAQDASAPAEPAGGALIGRPRNGGSAGNAPGTGGLDARNTAPIRWMTALECRWYRDQGLSVPGTGWHVCAEGRHTFKYRLLFGIWDLDEDFEL